MTDDNNNKIEKYELELITEQAELSNRINEIEELIDYRSLDYDVKKMLDKQLTIMKNYRKVLIKMINMLGYMQIKKELNEQ